MNYTEAPWEVRIWDGDDWPEKRISVGSINSKHAVCINPRYGWNVEDFNLIAAAPELLEALEDVLDGIGFLSGGDHELEGLGITEERGREIRNILKKARGEK